MSIALSKVFQEIREENLLRRNLIHCVVAVLATIHQPKQLDICMVLGSDYRFMRSTRISLSDFYLFATLKNKLRGQRFPSRGEVINAIKMHVEI